MKLEVGMYVRTKLGIAMIINIIDYYLDEDKKYIFDSLNDELWSDDLPNEVWEYDLKETVIAGSYEIIDLVRKGDYINGNHRVVDIIENNRKLKPSTMIYCEYGNSFIGFYNEDIRTIVTKEQFEYESYKVAEQNE